MKKHISSLILAVLLTFSMVACTSEDTPEVPAGNERTTTTTTPVDETPTTTTESPHEEVTTEPKEDETPVTEPFVTIRFDRNTINNDKLVAMVADGTIPQNVTHLYLNDQQSLSDISPLSGLTNLIELQLWNNQISDITPLTTATGY